MTEDAAQSPRLDLKRWCITIKGRLLGFERSTIWFAKRERYMDRWIVYHPFGTLRLHKFWRGDDDRASHTHPWWFITIPLSGYNEQLYDKGVPQGRRYVAPFRAHYRPADFEHIVLGRPSRLIDNRMGDWGSIPDNRPFWTIVLSGQRVNHWGFYPKPGEFIYWRDYK